MNPDFEASLPEIEWTRDALLRDLPSAVDNSTLLEGYMPPIFDQGQSYSCVHCAEIGYVLTYELNRLRQVPARSKWFNGTDVEMQNLYHPFFTYNFINNGSGKTTSGYGKGFEIVAENGCPSLIEYNNPVLNPPYSPDNNQLPFRYWMSGAEQYISATENGIEFEGDVEPYKITWEDNTYGSLDKLKRWLFTHNTRDGVGGLAIISVNMGHDASVQYNLGTIQAGSSHEGERIMTSWSSSGGHALTIVGYDDNIWVSNNHVQPNENTPLYNCERGAFKVANSWRTDWGNGGYIWVPYKLLAHGQLQVDSRAYTCVATKPDDKEVFLSATVAHPKRHTLQLMVGKGTNASVNTPEGFSSFKIFNYQGGNNNPTYNSTSIPMNGDVNYPAPIDLALNFSKKHSPYNCGKYFFQVVDNFTGNHPNGSAYVDNLQLHDYRWGEVFVLNALQPYAQIQSHGTTTLSVDYDLIFPFDIQQNCTYSTNKVARRTVTVGNQSTITIGEGVSLDMYGTEAYDCHLVIEANSTLVIGDNAVITAKRGNCEIVVNGNIQIGHNVTFKAEEGATLSIRINGQREITVTDCLFANASLQIDAQRGFSKAMPSSATVSNCQFEADAGLCEHALRLNGFSYITLADNTVDGIDDSGMRHYADGILIHNCGLAGLGSLVLRNTIKGCTEAGLTLYGSAGNIRRNEVTQCQYGVRLLNGSTVNDFTGNCAASNPSQTQHIHDNDVCEVFVHRDCMPQAFRHNRITSSGNSWLFKYENYVDDDRGLCIRIDLENNNWGNLTNTQIESRFLYVTNTNNGAAFDYLPKWTMGDCLVSGEDVWDRMTREADSLLGIGLYSSAKAGYKEIVSLYPNTSGATNAMKKLMMAESLSEENYGDIQQYYLNDTTIQNSPTLAALAGSLANKCDELLENYDEAIAWYEAVIQDEETPYNDSLFATIDLGNLYLKMEANGAKGAKGTLAQFVPKSAEAFAEQTDEALRKLKTHPSRLNPSRELPDQYWVDIVTEQPEGYVVDANGDVHLYSAEALAWLSVVSNGLNGQEADNFDGKKVTLEANVDMSEALWTPISESNSTPAFKGTFDGKEHVIDRLLLKAANSTANRTGVFAKIAEASLAKIVIRNGYFEGYGYGMGFFVSQALNSTIDHCFVECEMHGNAEMVPFVYANQGTDISNSMVYSPLLKTIGNKTISGTFVAINAPSESNAPHIQNCAAIIEKMDWTEYSGLAGCYNYGLIENSYAYIGEFIDFGGYGGGPAPRNGITENNMETGEIINCYYNRVRNHVGVPYYIEMDDLPAFANVGIIQNTLPYAEDEYGHWKLVEAITFELESGTVSTDDLLEALNLKVQQMEGDNFLSWCDTNPVFNSHDLPVFCNLDITETAENTATDNQSTLHPNPTNGEVTVTCEGLSRIRIVNAFGQTVYNATHQGDQARIDLSPMAKGIYMMHIEASGGQTVRKIVVE